MIASLRLPGFHRFDRSSLARSVEGGSTNLHILWKLGHLNIVFLASSLNDPCRPSFVALPHLRIEGG